jgi:hypothetical protein
MTRLLRMAALLAALAKAQDKAGMRSAASLRRRGSSERGMNLRRVHDAEFTITTKVPLKLCHVGLRNHSSPTEISRLDILVHPEDVFWIVFGLDFAELCIVAAIRGRKALAILIR